MVNIKMANATEQKLSPKITVIGVGGAGGNAVNNMISSNLEGCEFVVCNTDSQALEHSLCDDTVQLGAEVTGGLGAGSRPEIGKAAAEETLDEVMKYLDGANMAFVTAGMGGGTGTGAAPVIARACRDRGILTVGVVTKPFHFEGSHRMKMAEQGIEEMQDVVDTLIVIPNQNLFRVANEKTTFAQAFEMADSVLRAGVGGVTDLMVKPGLVNLDFADVRTAMLEMGKAMMGTGEAEGDKRAIEAAEAAINNPLLDDVSMKGAHGVIINVTGGYDMTLFEADEACNRIRDEVDSNANIIFGATFDESLEGSMRVSIVATGIERESDSKDKRDGSTMSGGNNTSGGKTFERTMPKTQSKPVAPSGIRNAQNAPFSALQQPSAPKVSEEQAAEIVEQVQVIADTDTDMFDHGRYTEGEALPQNTALRGTLYKDAFIPPRPASVEIFDAMSAPQNSLNLQMAPVQQPQESAPMAQQPSTPIGSSLKLNPPKLPEKEVVKRSPSLFERITGTVQQTLEGAMGTSSSSEHEQRKRAPSFHDLKKASESNTASPSQGRLNIDSPAGEKTEEDNLDIPAFLRRQAN